jgi:hypothetical protein
MKKTKLLLASLFLILLGIAFSCKVDLESLGEPIDTESNNLLNRARISFEERLKNDPILKKYKIEPIWDNAISYKNTVEVSFKMDGRIYRPSIVKNQKNSGRAKLLLTEKGSKFSIVIAHYIPSILYKGKIGSITSQNLKTNNFDGIVSMEELESDKKTNFHFINGKVVKKTYVFDKNKTKKSGRTQICTETCTYYEIETEWYQQNPGVSEPQYVYSTFRVESECVTTCDNDPDPPFCEQFPDLCVDNYSGGSGNSGSSDITNQLTTDCFKQALANLGSSNFKGTVADIFQNYNKNPNANFTIKEQVFMGINATFNAYTDGNVITLNTEMLRDASKELIALTILHEMLHVYISQSELEDHNITAAKYINPMADYIHALYGLDLEVAKSLVWAGLQDTPAWEQRTEQQQYQSINNERLHINKNNFNHGQIGTHCN